MWHRNYDAYIGSMGLKRQRNSAMELQRKCIFSIDTTVSKYFSMAFSNLTTCKVLVWHAWLISLTRLIQQQTVPVRKQTNDLYPHYVFFWMDCKTKQAVQAAARESSWENKKCHINAKRWRNGSAGEKSKRLLFHVPLSSHPALLHRK